VLSTGDTSLTHRKGIVFGIINAVEMQDEEYVQFLLPEFRVDDDPVQYIDSFFARKEIPVRSSANEPNSIMINLIMEDLLPKGGALLYIMSCAKGVQPGSIIKVNKFVKSKKSGVKKHQILICPIRFLSKAPSIRNI